MWEISFLYIKWVFSNPKNTIIIYEIYKTIDLIFPPSKSKTCILGILESFKAYNQKYYSESLIHVLFQSGMKYKYCILSNLLDMTQSLRCREQNAKCFTIWDTIFHLPEVIY